MHLPQRRASAVAALIVVGVHLLARPADAQQARRERAEAEVTIVSAEGAAPDFDTRSLRHAFDLFAAADGAFSGMRATGNYGSSINNYGPCDGTFVNCQNSRVWVGARNAWYAPFFEIQYYVGAPPSQYLKIRQVAPSIANATGGGWTANHTRRVVGSNTVFGPADGSLGRLFSGVTSAADGSCRDHTLYPNGWYRAGFQLLATSDCPETWGREGWGGAHPIDAAGWKKQSDRLGPAFTWAFWRVPAEDRRLDRPFLGTNHHTYGESSDFNSQALADYGSAVPGGVGAPRSQGYPLGLWLRFDAFNFADPRVSDAYFVQMTIVNRSAEMWGTPIDYDSLYFGLGQGALFSNDNDSRYALLDKGLLVYHNSNVQGPGGPCDDAYRQPYPGRACVGNATVSRGYRVGAIAKIFLKTPIGDLRNKLFTRRADGSPCVEGQDPFCRPSHGLRGDTITFNHQSFGDYGGGYQWTWGNGARSAFGFIAGDEVNTLAGRDPGTATDRQLWTTFRSEDWQGNSLAGKVHYNKYVPPASRPWDYDHDGVPDTLALAVCGRHGCSALDSDTMPGGWLNSRGNIGGIQGFGPFRLRAGDTTAFVYAIVGSGDSARLWAQVDAVIDLYLNFYASPEPPPPPRVVSTTVSPGTHEGRTEPPAVGLALSDDAWRWVDPYLLEMADDVEAAAPGTALGTLRALNDGKAIVVVKVDTLPGPVYDTTFVHMSSTNLVSALRQRAAANVEQIEIYKSCDEGRTFTSDPDCRGDPSTSAPGPGWGAYAVLPVSSGQTDRTFADRHAIAGRTYRYAVVAKSRGATFLLNTPSGQGSVTFAPSLRNPLPRSTSDPNLVDVYVPVSRPAGYREAETTFSTRPGGVTVPFTVVLSEAPAGGSYQAIFGNQLLVDRDSLISTGAAVRSMVTVRRQRSVDVGTGTADSTLEAHVYEYPFATPFPVAGTPAATTSATVGDTVRTRQWFYPLAFLVVGPAGPIFGSRTFDGSDATPLAAAASPLFAGFTISADNTLATTYDPDAERHVRGPVSLTAAGLPATDTVVPREVVNNGWVQWQEAQATRLVAADGRGRYEITWRDDAFGLTEGLVLDLGDSARVEAELQAALAARLSAGIALTDTATATLLHVDPSQLMPLHLPFTAHNRTFDRPVAIAALARPTNRLVLGFAGERLSVAIPPDAWVPGDALVFIEDIEEDSVTSRGLVLDSLGAPVRRLRRAVTFGRAVLACDFPRPGCNPLREGTPGATGFVPLHDGDRTEFAYHAGFTESGAYTFEVTPAVAAGAITSVTDSALRQVRVVPNPFVVYSAYQTAFGQGRLLFTHMPPRGTLRIYTVAAQLVQQITWEPADLVGDGDLHWDLRTRGGLEAAGGLYIWVLTAPSDPANPASAPVHARGKFVIVR